jgi:predicted dinucleotide-binding enzyme
MTTIGLIGSGHIGAAIAQRAVESGHDVVLSNSRGPETLADLVDRLGDRARAGTAAEAAAEGDLVVVTIPFKNVDQVPVEPLAGKVVIDATNQYGPGAKPADGQTVAEFNSARMPGARYVRGFNTLTAGFQAEASSRPGDERAVLFICGDYPAAKGIVATLIEDAGFAPVDLGSNADAAVMEAPRRPGSVFGEEYRLPQARAVAEAVHQGHEVPPTPHY